VTDTPLSLAFSPCPNDTFAFYAWTHGLIADAPAVELTFADVDVTNGAAERGEFDVVKVSYAALPWLLDKYALLPSGGALGRGCGPLVLTAGRTDLRGASVAVPGERTTAYLLFRLWAADQGVGEVTVLPFPEIMPAVRDGKFDAGLVIHEARFTFGDYGLTSVVDLGAWWEATTGLAIPLGAILARRDLGADEIARISRTVKASVQHAFADPSASREFVAAHATEMDPEVQARHIALYVNEFSVDVGDEGFAAITGLLDRAAAAGLVPQVDPAALRLPTA
jgi:1,4-dihydroxy-6-naphthoate synthase